MKRVTLREMTIKECKTALNFIIEEFGDIPIGRLDREKGTLIRSHIRKLPKTEQRFQSIEIKIFMNYKMKIPSEI